MRAAAEGSWRTPGNARSRTHRCMQGPSGTLLRHVTILNHSVGPARCSVALEAFSLSEGASSGLLERNVNVRTRRALGGGLEMQDRSNNPVK